jgi:hypothetical protein
VVGASAGEDACTSRDADLNGRGADAAVCAVDEQHLAQSYSCLREKRVVRRYERLRDGSRLIVAETIRDRRDMAFVNEHAVGQTATANEPEDAVALGEVTHRCAPRENGPRDFEAGHVLRRPRRSWIRSRPLREIGGVDTRERRGHQQLFTSRHRIRPLLEAHDLASAGARKDDRSHVWASARREVAERETLGGGGDDIPTSILATALRPGRPLELIRQRLQQQAGGGDADPKERAEEERPEADTAHPDEIR